MYGARTTQNTFPQCQPDIHISTPSSCLSAQDRIDSVAEILAVGLLRWKCRRTALKGRLRNSLPDKENSLINAQDKWHIHDNPSPKATSKGKA